VKVIESPQNPLIKEVAKLLRKRKRDEPFLIEGPNLLEAALREGTRARVRKLFYTPEFKDREAALFERLLAGAAKMDSEVFELSRKALDRITDTGTPQGVAAVAELESVSLVECNVNESPVIVLDGIQDPGNLGTIIRTADAAGASAVILIEGETCDALNPKAMRASAGSIFNLPVVIEKREQALAALTSLGLKIIAAAPEGGVEYFDAELLMPLAIVLGNEAKGVSREFMEQADVVVSIPVRGGAESLNVSAAAAVLIYEALRQA
jgi:TrmH family RNA methyltransferase